MNWDRNRLETDLLYFIEWAHGPERAEYYKWYLKTKEENMNHDEWWRERMLPDGKLSDLNTASEYERGFIDCWNLNCPIRKK